MTNLNELATKLQEFIIRSQSDAHNGRGFSKSRYNNLKLKISSTLEYPNVIVAIGISEATYNIEDGTKTDGSLGPDEKYIYKWIGKSNIQHALKELYLSMTELVDLEEEQNELQEELAEEIKGDMEGSAGESKFDDRKSRRSKRNNFRNLMMPPMMDDNQDEDRKKGKKKSSILDEPLETVSSDYEEYNEDTDLEVYQEQQFESLEESSKQHNFLNFMQNMFGKNKKDED